MPSSEPRVEETTKRCPFCAEVIKAAAIKCRYCQSDLSESAPVQPAAKAEPGPERRSDPGPGPDSGPGSDSGRRRSFQLGPGQLRAALAVALVLVLVFLGLAFRDWRAARDLEAAEDAGRTVRAAVSDKVEALFTYGYATFDKDLEAAQKGMTDDFRKEYSATVDDIRAGALEQKRSQQAEVRAVAVISQSPERVEALVFANRVSSTEGSKQQEFWPDRLKVTMVKVDGAWLVDDLSVPQS